ncbi:MAG: hypothetical protein KUG81_09140 [Gammaproteobacteria bacterium]|nr:hypothetical protein [Gammaproteobacteria bacterium]
MNRTALSNYFLFLFKPVLIVVFFNIPYVCAVHDEGPHNLGRLVTAVEGKKVFQALGRIDDPSCLNHTS